MEKRNIIEDGRTPDMEKQASVDDMEQEASHAFSGMSKDAGLKYCGIEPCPNCKRRKTLQQPKVL